MTITNDEFEAFIWFLRKHKDEIMGMPKGTRGWSVGKDKKKVPDDYIEYTIKMKADR